MKKASVLILALVLVLSCLSVTAFAHEVPDLTKDGTITLTIIYEEKELSGGQLELYRVGDIKEDDGNYFFALDAAYGGSALTEEDLNDPDLAANIGKTIADTNADNDADTDADTIAPVATADIKDGAAVFSDVEPGLYLVYQKTATPGFEAMSPFLISMPNFVDGKYETEVSAVPKVGLETVPPPAVTVPSLPQTGQLNWPIPVLAVLGFALVVVGIVLKTRKKATYEE